MPAEIVLMPPIPETAIREYEVFCRDCRTHEGMFRQKANPRLRQIRDRHNRLHHAEASSHVPGSES